MEDSLEGVTKITFPGAPGQPAKLTTLNSGMKKVSWSPFYGSQGVRVGNIEGRPSFIAQIAPWEGVDVLSPATVAVLVPGVSGSIFEPPLKRIELDVLGPQMHDVATGKRERRIFVLYVFFC